MDQAVAYLDSLFEWGKLNIKIHKLILLKNALKGSEECRLTTSEFRYNFEYLDCLKYLNTIYQSYSGSDCLLELSPGDSSTTMLIDAEAYLFEYIGPSINSELSEDEIQSKLERMGVEYYTSEFIAKSIKTGKPLDLVDMIKNHIATAGQFSSYYIDIADAEGNEERIEC